MYTNVDGWPQKSVTVLRNLDPAANIGQRESGAMEEVEKQVARYLSDPVKALVWVFNKVVNGGAAGQ